MSARITVLGNINIDFVMSAERLPEPGENLRAASLRLIPGGKGANQAVAAARLGAQVDLIGCVGADVFGPPLLQGLARDNVNTQGVRRERQATTGAAFVTVTPDGQSTILSALGANLKCSEQQVEEAAEIIERSDMLLVQLGVPPSVVDRAMQIAVDRGVTVLLDPSPIGDDLPQLWRRADILVPNQTELGHLARAAVSDIPDVLQAASELRACGVTAVVTTLGAQGCLLVDDEGARLVHGYPVEPVDATGAGDAFAAALGTRIAEGDSFNEAAVFANAAGALATTVSGAQPSLPTREAVGRFLRKQGGAAQAIVEPLRS